MQLFPSRDRAGRRILIHIDYNTTNKLTVKSRLRIGYYTQMALADDIETQRKGTYVKVIERFEQVCNWHIIIHSMLLLIICLFLPTHNFSISSIVNSFRSCSDTLVT